MGVKPDKWIKDMASRGMIEPFEPSQVKKGISFGVSSYGYDFRLGREFKIFEPGKLSVVDPKNIENLTYKDFTADVCEIPPHGFVLGRTLEYFRIPRDVITLCTGKSTYARCGIYLHVTPFEPEWEGYATIAISNHTPLAARIYAGEGIGQILFLAADGICETSYSDRKGRYQAQKEITMAKGRGASHK